MPPQTIYFNKGRSRFNDFVRNFTERNVAEIPRFQSPGPLVLLPSPFLVELRAGIDRWQELSIPSRVQQSMQATPTSEGVTRLPPAVAVSHP